MPMRHRAFHRQALRRVEATCRVLMPLVDGRITKQRSRLAIVARRYNEPRSLHSHARKKCWKHSRVVILKEEPALDAVGVCCFRSSM